MHFVCEALGAKPIMLIPSHIGYPTRHTGTHTHISYLLIPLEGPQWLPVQALLVCLTTRNTHKPYGNNKNVVLISHPMVNRSEVLDCLGLRIQSHD